MKQPLLTDIARNNKTALTAHRINTIVMTIFCILQASVGLQPWSYVLIVAFLGFLPIGIETFIFRKNPEAKSIKPIFAIGFLIFYTYTLFTSTNNLVFVFVIPIILVFSIYNDTFASLLLNASVVLENILIVAIGANTGKFGYAGSDSAIIQIVFVILIGVYSYLTSKTLNTNTHQKIANITEAQNKTAALASQTKMGIEQLYEELDNLNVAAQSTKTAMQSVSSGAADTADSVQNQLIQTQAIQEKVEQVNRTASEISENMNQTLEILQEGSRDIAALIQKVDVSVQNGADVAEKLKTLDKYMAEMNSIVELISGITSQTSLLALNASIEAARAGQAGKGFAVVANEISAMSTQTKDATTHITALIQNVTSAISEVVEVIRLMIEGIHEEKQSTTHAADSFTAIESNTRSIQSSIEMLTGNISELRNANEEITNDIHTISSISESLSTHAGETMHSEEKNAVRLETLSAKMQGLLTLVQ